MAYLSYAQALKQPNRPQLACCADRASSYRTARQRPPRRHPWPTWWPQGWQGESEDALAPKAAEHSEESRSYSLAEGREPMTQLIAALCDGGKTAVAVSDRMVSTSDMTLGFEAPDAKSEIISDKFVVLIAGTIHEPDLVRDVQQKAKGKDRFREIADVFKDLYQELRTKRIEDEILRPRLGIETFDEFHKKQRMLGE